MTTERIIQYDGKIDFYNLQLMQLTESDITSETTDNQVSKKLIDKDGNIVMLIEAQTMDYYSNDDLSTILDKVFGGNLDEQEKLLNVNRIAALISTSSREP